METRLCTPEHRHTAHIAPYTRVVGCPAKAASAVTGRSGGHGARQHPSCRPQARLHGVLPLQGDNRGGGRAKTPQNPDGTHTSLQQRQTRHAPKSSMSLKTLFPEKVRDLFGLDRSLPSLRTLTRPCIPAHAAKRPETPLKSTPQQRVSRQQSNVDKLHSGGSYPNAKLG